MKVLVTGAEGQLGSEIKTLSYKLDYYWVFTKRKNFNFLNLKNINSRLDKINPNIIINCAAYTNVNNAEDNFESANIINHLAVKLIAEWSYKNNCKLIHISTDYVFDGKSKIILKEESITNPLNIYGKTKLSGEIACINANPDSIILRTSWLYSAYGDNFLINIINLMRRKPQIKVINDQIGSPTYAADLAEIILDIISAHEWKPGIYHYTNDAEISWFDFAKNIKKYFDFNVIINGISSDEYDEIVTRPKYTVLDKTKIKKTFNIKIIPYAKSLKRCISVLKNQI